MDWFDKLVQPGPVGGTMELAELATRLGVAFGFGVAVATTHAFAGWLARRKLDRAFLTTLVLLSVVIALVTVVVGNDAARAFTLAGSLAIVRFRTVVEDTRDTAFVIFAVVAGMAAASDYVVGPLLVIPLVLLTVLALRPGPPSAGPAEGTLVIRVTIGKPVEEPINAMLRTRVAGFRLVGVTTSRGGSAYDLTYRIPLPGPTEVFALVADLGGLDGVQGVELKER